MSKPWGNIKSWATEAEEAEAEEKKEAAMAAAAAAVAPTARDTSSFPSLKEAATKPKRKVKMSLHEFTTMQATGYDAGGGSRRDSDYNKGLTPEEMMRLPTGPKERSAEEMQYGRGFSSYGGRSSGPPPGRRDGDGDSSWGSNRRSYGGFEDDRRGPPPSRVSDFDQPSRADEVDNWAMAKKPMQAFDSGRPRFGSSGGGGGGPPIGSEGFSRADETDNWALNKKPVAPAPASRSLSFGSGFRDSVAPETDRWARGVGLPWEGDQERRRLVLDPPRGESAPVVEPVMKTNKPNPFGAARPREEILAEKGVDWKTVDMELEAKKVTSRPTSSQSNSRPGSAQSSRSDAAAVTKPKVNPFGDAKPREVLLQEKGLDWRKIDLDLEHRRVDRPGTEAEKILKEEIDHLKKEFEKESMSKESAECQTGLHDQILFKEKELEVLIREFDDKIRFGQKAIERPGSGAGRVASFQERPPSQPGSFEESRSVEFTERPRSRGTGDAWGRPGEDRRGFPGGRERGFPGSRDSGRSMSRERW